MAASTRKAEVHIALNGTQAQNGLKDLDRLALILSQDLERMAKELKDIEITLGTSSKEYKALSREMSGVETRMKAYTAAVDVEAEKTKKLGDVVADLANTKLRDLKRAVGSGRTALQGLTGSDEDLKKAEEIRKQMKQVMDMQRLIEGEYVKIAEGLSTVGTKSDQWLSKAIKQQKDLVASLDKTDAEYKKQEGILRQLTAEEERRAAVNATAIAKQKAAKASATLEQNAKSAYSRAAVGNFTGMTEAQLRADKKAMEEYQQTIQMGGEKWNRYSQAIANVETHMKSFRQTQAQVGMDVAQAQQLAQTGKNPSGKVASLNDIKEAQRVMQEYRNTLNDTASIKNTDKILEQLNARFNQLNGTTKEAAISWRKMRDVMNDPKNATGEDIKKTMEAIQQRIAKLPAGSAMVARLRGEYTKLEQVLKGTEKHLVNVNDVIARGKQGKASINELKQAYKQLEEELNKINTGTKEFAAKQKDLKGLKKQIDEVTGAANKQSSAWSTAMKNLTAYVGLFAVFNRAKQMFTDLFRLNTQFSEQLTNIRKVALITNDEVAKISRELTKLDTRTSLEELNKIAYSGAKLGVQTRGGTEALAGFVRAADQVNVALKEDLGEEALTALAKITEVMGLIDKMGVEQAMLKTGSAIFRLASTSTATSGKIIDFSNRMLAVGEQAALSTPDILALGAAVDRMALPPEVAATAFSKLVVSIRKGTLDIEKDLGIAEGTLKKLVESGKGVDAIRTIFEAMNKTGNVFALDGLFKDLGSDGQRLITTMVTMGAKSGMLKESIDEANKAFKAGTAVTVEYNMQQETAQAYMERAANLWEKQFVSADAASGPIRDMAKAWYEVTQELTSSISFMTEVRVAIALIFSSIKLLLSLLPTFITVISTAGLAGAFAKLMVAVQGASTAGFTFSEMLAVVKARYQALNLVMKASAWGAIIGLLGVGLVKLAAFAVELNKVAAGQRVLNDVQEEGTRKAMEEQETLKRLHNVMKDTTASMNLRAEAMSKLNSAIPDLQAKIDLETGSVVENTKAWEENFKRLQDYYELEGARAKLSELGRKKVDAILDLQKKEDAYANTNADIPTGPQTSGGANMPSQAQGAIGQAGQKAAAETARDDAQRALDDIMAQEEALRKKFGARLDVDGKSVTEGKLVGGGSGTPTAPEETVKSEITEFITNIKNFYKRQKTALLEEVVDNPDITQEMQDDIARNIDAKMNEALQKAKDAVVLGKDAWNEFRQTMDKDIKERADENGQSQSIMLLEKVQEYDTADMHKRMIAESYKVRKKKLVPNPVADVRDRAFGSKMWLSASGDAEKTANAEVKRQREVEKILMEHDYTGIVNKNTAADMEKMGAFALDDEQISTLFADDPAKIEDMLNVRAEEISILLKNAREHISDLYATDVSTEEGRNRLLEILFGKNWDQDNSQLKAVFDLYGDDMQAFYQKLIQYSDEYTEAEKKAADERKKVNTFLWNHDEGKMFSDEVIKTSEGQKKEDARQRSFGAKSNPDTPWGQVTENDPEIALFMLKLEQAQAYYNFLKEHSADEAQLAEQSKAITDAQSSLMDAIVAKAAKTAEAQRKWYKPIEQYGTALGEALTDESKSVKDATKSMINSFIDLTGEYVNQKLTQWIMTKLYNSLMASSEQELATTKQTVAVTNATTAVTEAGVEVAAGTAAGAAQTIGQLGWWGIPLVAAITAVLGGLMALAKGALSNAFSSGADAAKTNTKLVSGMLTYDEGNVQQYRGTDGQVYSAQQVGALTTGIVTSPIATTVNGQPSLVGERGPEIVVGRETTAAIMRNDPGLLSALVNYDRNYSGRRYRTYDEGNVQSAVQTQQNGANVAQDNMQLMQLMSSVLHYLQNPVAPNINMYGRGGLHEKMQKADSFMKNR